ncbi:MAG: hypothetical protein IAI50_06470 [Candidatus Eremiobacteraeota bacterium]|nr:hypothetical protein [Candidatus Eremiobacteraeota bacterium]
MTNDPAKPDDSDAPEHSGDPREAETIDPHSGMSDDPRVDPTPDRRQSR